MTAFFFFLQSESFHFEREEFGLMVDTVVFIRLIMYNLLSISSKYYSGCPRFTM